MIFLFYLLLGAIASFLSGLLGIGGGLVLVPGLALIFSAFHIAPHSQIMHISIATSLAGSIINLVLSTRAHHVKQAVRWQVFRAISPGVLMGALLIGPLIMLIVNENFLQTAFGVFCIFIFLQLVFFQNKKIEQEKLPGSLVLAGLGLFIGSIATVLGLAGGALIGTLLYHYHMDAKKVAGTSASISVVIAVAGTIGLLFASHSQYGLPAYSTGYIYWPALLAITLPSLFLTSQGAHLAHRLPVHLLKKLFGGLMLIIGLKMLIGV